MRVALMTSLILLAPVLLGADEKTPTGVVAILLKHDKVLVEELADYVIKNPRATDIDQAYMALFDKVIEHDWFLDHERLAKNYLADRPEGAVRPLAQIIAVMARARDGKFPEAFAVYKTLMSSLSGPDQEEFAGQFADSVAHAAIAAGEYPIAKQVYQTLLKQYAESPNLKQKVDEDLAKLDKVDKPAPRLAVKDVNGASIRLEDFKGKYVLLDFWATWCAPCIAELPNQQSAYTKYHSKGLEIVAVSLDENRQAVVDFVKARKVPWKQVHNMSSGGDLVELYGISSIPATFLIDPEGKIIRLELRGPALEETLAKLIK